MNPKSLIKHISAVAVFAGALLPMVAWANTGAMIEEVEATAANKVLPKIINHVAPVYPESLVHSGAEGVVIVTFTVDEKGRVRDPRVASSPAKALNAHAIKAVSNWKFAAGQKEGKQASFKLKTAIEFKAGSKAAPVEMAMANPTVADSQPAKSQPTYDVGPSAKSKVAPVYPLEMLLAGRSGWAEANFVVDYSGRTMLANAAGASDGPFAKAVIAMIEASEFAPARKDKHPVIAAATERITFAGEEALDPTARRILAELRKETPALLTVHEADERPKAVTQKSPAYPRALRDDGLTGQAEIEFVVDAEGRVHFPRIVSASHEDFGWAAATAVSQWRYQPAMKNGEKVEVRMRVPVLFDARQLAAAE